MSNNLENIDQLFKGNLQNATIPAPAGTWEAVSSQMAGTAAGGTVTGLTILKVAITIAIAAGSGLVVHKLTNTKKVSPQVETAEVLTAIKKEEVKDLDGNLDFKIEDSSKPIQVTAINKVKNKSNK